MPRTIVSVTHNIYKDPAGTSVAFDPNAWDAVQAGDLLIFIEASASASMGGHSSTPSQPSRVQSSTSGTSGLVAVSLLRTRTPGQETPRSPRRVSRFVD
jgi:hypothetical protein